MYFNKTIASEYDLPDHYEIARNGKWTYDLFLSEIKMISVDLNGDGTMDGADKVGISGDMTEMLSAIPFACGMHLVAVTEDGPKLDFFSEKLVEVYDKTYEVFMDRSVSQIYFRTQEAVKQNFVDNRSLFSIGEISLMTAFRAHDVDFGVLPMPKYDEAQENYRCLVWATLCCVPTTILRPELVGACLEQFAYESADVQTAYNEDLIRGKSTRDLESLEMLDIIYASQVGDISLNYLGFDDHFRQIFYCYYELMKTKNQNISSHYKSVEKSATRVLEKLYDKILKNQELNN